VWRLCFKGNYEVCSRKGKKHWKEWIQDRNFSEYGTDQVGLKLEVDILYLHLSAYPSLIFIREKEEPTKPLYVSNVR